MATTFKELMAENGYTVKTTFWDDFSIADRFGVPAIENTYIRAFKEWYTDYVYLAELVLVLNHKTWQWYKHDDYKFKVYRNLFYQAAQWAEENLTGDELNYYFKTTD